MSAAISQVRKVANAPVSWGILEVGDWGDTPYNAFLEQLHDLDFTGTELGPPGYLPEDAMQLKRELREKQLELIAAFVPVAFANWDAEERQRIGTILRHLEDVGCASVLISDAGAKGRRGLEERFSPEASLTDGEWIAFANAIREIHAQAESLGLKVMFHHHVGSFVETPEEIEKMLELTEPIGIDLCLDTGHLTWAGGDVLTFATRYKHRIGHLHLKDIHEDRLEEARKKRLDFVSAVQSGIFVPLGEGAIDFDAIFAMMDDIRYDGWFVVEQDRLGEDTSGTALSPFEAARRSRAFLKDHLE